MRGSAERIARDVATPARLFVPGRRHVVDKDLLTGLALDPPEDLPRGRILYRGHTLKMASLAGHPQVGLVGDLLVVAGMALEAVPRRLIGMSVSSRCRVAGETGERTVRCRGVGRDVDPAETRIPGRRAPFPWFPSVAVKAEPRDLLRGLRITGRRLPVTPHAPLVRCRGPGQNVAVLVTGAALLFGRPGKVDSGLSRVGRHRIVRFMAADATRQLLGGLVRQAAMGSFVDSIEDLDVAVFTGLDAEECLEGLVHVPGVRMDVLLKDVGVALPAGCPAVGRYMEPLRIDEPGSVRLGCAAEEQRQDEGQKEEIKDSGEPIPLHLQQKGVRNLFPV